jgi:DNA-binding transcriptional MerR regulator
MRDHVTDGYLKVGELARRAGVSIRTLHHYDAIGLLRPSFGGGGQQRLYGAKEIARLQHIRLLQSLGLTLEEVGASLDDPNCSILGTVERQLDRLDGEIDTASRLRTRLEDIAKTLRSAEIPSVETLLQTMETMTEMEKHYTPKQWKQLEARRGVVGPDRMAAVEGEWNDLFDAFRTAMRRGDDVTTEPVLELARQARALITEFTGGDPGIERSLGDMHAKEPRARERIGVEPELWEYMARARQALTDGDDPATA